jgi:DNA-binding response OmpR family regulator
MSGEERTYTVLLADDDDNLIQALCRQMRKEGFNLIIAVDGYQALHLSRTQKPDVLVLDINMPASDGFVMQERMKAVPGMEDVPVIYITGERSERVTSGANASDAFAVIFKPFDTQDLVKTIRAAVTREVV